MKKAFRILVALAGLAVAGTLIVAAVTFTAFQGSSCNGLSDADIARLAAPEVVLSLTNSNLKPLKSLRADEKGPTIDLLKRNTTGWARTNSPARGHSYYLVAEPSVVGPVGLGRGYLSKGNCQRELSGLDLDQLSELLN